MKLLNEQVKVQRRIITNIVGQVSLAETLGHTLTGTIPRMPSAEIVKAHAEYEHVTEGECPKEERSSDAQITAVFLV